VSLRCGNERFYNTDRNDGSTSRPFCRRASILLTLPLHRSREYFTSAGRQPIISTVLLDLGDFVDIDAQRGCDFLERLNRPLALAGLDLRQIGRGQATGLRESLDG
jgi:hypothetical protein